LFLATTLAMFIIQAFGVYLRAHKDEPFLLQSTLVAVATLFVSVPGASRWGEWGVAFSYLTCTGVFGLFLAATIFRAKRAEWHRIRFA
jgi:hypothetical protein